MSIPRGVLPAVSGGAGTGKSSLIQGCLPQAHPGMIIIGQNLAHGSRRPTTATYTGILDNVRKAFVKANKVDTALFSANTKGAAAPTGTGVVHRS